MSNERYQYDIGGVTYTAKNLVLGQINQLMKLMEGVLLPQDANVVNLISAFGDKLPKAFAILFHVPGVSLKDKDVDKVAADIEFELTPEMTIEVVEDFFDYVPISSLIEKMGKTMEKVGEKMSVGSKPSVSTLQVETLPKEKE